MYSYMYKHGINCILVNWLTCQTVMESEQLLHVSEVIAGNPGSIISSRSFQERIQPVGNFLQLVTSEAMLIRCLAFIVQNQECVTFLHSVLQLAVH